MSNETLKNQIKKLAQKSAKNKALALKLSGSHCRANFESCKHIIEKKKKYTYIDQGDGTYSRSGRFLVQNQDDKIAKAGYVWGIKGYGQKGSPIGDINKVIKQLEKDNLSLKQGVKIKKKKKSYAIRTSDSIYLGGF